MMGKLEEKNRGKKIFFFVSLKSMKESNPKLDPDPDPWVRGTDPGIRNRIRTKMSRIPNTAIWQVSHRWQDYPTWQVWQDYPWVSCWYIRCQSRKHRPAPLWAERAVIPAISRKYCNTYSTNNSLAFLKKRRSIYFQITSTFMFFCYKCPFPVLKKIKYPIF